MHLYYTGLKRNLDYKKVNPLLQTAATIIVPTGLYAFKRINKLRKGIIIYAISYVVSIAMPFMLTIIPSMSNSFYLTGIVYGVLFSFALPMVAIKKWSVDYNKKLESLNHIL